MIYVQSYFNGVRRTTRPMQLAQLAQDNIARTQFLEDKTLPIVVPKHLKYKYYIQINEGRGTLWRVSRENPKRYSKVDIPNMYRMFAIEEAHPEREGKYIYTIVFYLPPMQILPNGIFICMN